MITNSRRQGSATEHIVESPVPLHHTLMPTLKRGSLVAAANWQVTLIQAIADS
jgi:hypothetical protein